MINQKQIKKRIKNLDYILQHEYNPYFLKIEYYQEMKQLERYLENVDG